MWVFHAALALRSLVIDFINSFIFATMRAPARWRFLRPSAPSLHISWSLTTQMPTKRRQISVILSRRIRGLRLARKQTKSVQLNAGPASMRIVNIHEAKTHLSRLVDRAAKGEPFAIAKAGIERIGLIEGSIEVPDEFDRMGADENCRAIRRQGIRLLLDTYLLWAAGQSRGRRSATEQCGGAKKASWKLAVAIVFGGLGFLLAKPASADDLACVSTTFRLVGANDKVCVSAFDDPKVPGIACSISQARTGGVKGSLGLAEDPSRFSLSCRQTGPVSIDLAKLPEKDQVYSARTSIFFKRTHVYRIVDRKRNTLVYLAISDKIVNGSPYNALSSVPIVPWAH